jgi:hypothetical protein
MKIAVLGSGVIGVTSAYYLAKAGHEVTVVDRQPGPALETSYANAGEISPGYASPWAAPGIPRKAIKWMLMKHAPLVLRPRLDPDMAIWLGQMLRNCTSVRYAVNKSRMVRLAEYSRDKLIELRAATGIRYDDRQAGTLQVFRSETQLEGIGKDIEVLRKDGVPFEVLDVTGCVAAEPALGAVRDKIVGGLGSRLMQYQAFHSGSSNGIGRDKMHLYESLSLPFPLPSHELASSNADEIIREVAKIFKQFERVAGDAAKRSNAIRDASAKLQPLVEAYYSVTDAEKMLIDDTLALNQPSIHRSNIDANIPALAFPEASDRKRYADTLCDVLNRRARKHDLRISAQGLASTKLNLIFLTVIFSGERKPYAESNGDDELWTALDRVSTAAKRDNRSLSYLRGFSYFESDRLHMLKPATMRNWSRTAALNDADAIFEYSVRQEA